MAEAGIFVHSDAQLMAGALAKVLARSRRIGRQAAPEAPPDSAFAARAAASVERAFAAGRTDALCEYEARALLSECGIAASAETLCRSADEAVAAAEKLGFPVALKIQSPSILHKTEIGGVRLGVATAAEARAAYSTLTDAVARAAPNAVVHGVLVQKMAPPGHEVIVGAIHDATFGPVMMVGLGGIAVELYSDVAYWPAPLSPEEAESSVALAQVERAVRRLSRKTPGIAATAGGTGVTRFSSRRRRRRNAQRDSRAGIESRDRARGRLRPHDRRCSAAPGCELTPQFRSP